MTAASFRLAFISGGAKSGKSRYAQNLAEKQPGPRIYVATGQALDEEMRLRITRHQQERGAAWITREEPVALGQALQESDGRSHVILVDCLTMWLSNLMLAGEVDLEAERQRLVEILRALVTPVILVTNEVGWGIVPDNPLARRFRDAAGALHQKLAALAEVAVLVVNGLPLCLKGHQFLNDVKD